MKFLYQYILYCLLLISYSGWAQSFTTKVSARSIGKKDVVQVEYIAENLELSDFKLPTFKGWSIQSGPNFSSTHEQSGNQVKQKIIYSFLLQPLRTGRLSVPSATITIDKHNVRQSNTITVEVKDVDHVAGNNISAMPQVPSLFDDPPVQKDDFGKEQVLQKGESARDKIKNNLLVKLDVNKTTCFVGEPIIATYKLCTRLKSQSRVIQQPAFNGATVTELTSESPTAKREMINGRLYNVYVIRKVQLYPLQEGNLILPEASVENKVSFYKTGNINFRDLYYDRNSSDIEETQITLSNKPVVVNVKALPADAPSNFSGAIGNFRIAALPSDDKPITTKSSATFTVVVEGNGNLQQTKAPSIAWPNGVEAFDPTEKEEYDKSSTPVIVRKSFTYPFVVNKAGNYTIPSVKFNFYNPNTGKYETITSQPVSFNAAKGKTAIFSAVKRAGDASFETRLYIILGAALVAVAAGLLYFSRKQQTVPAVAAAPANINTNTTIAKEYIAPVTDQYIHNISALNPLENKNFYKQLQRELLGYIITKYNIDESGIDELALKRPQDVECLIKLKALLKDCRLGMYTPVFNTEEEMKHRLVAIEILTKLERSSVV